MDWLLAGNADTRNMPKKFEALRGDLSTSNGPVSVVSSAESRV